MIDRASAGAGPAALRTSTPQLRVLVVEDDEHDAELVLRELKRAGLNPKGQRVQTEADFRRAVSDFRPQIILSDFSMPQFDGIRALALARELCPDVPFLFVSGTLGEEYAIRALKDGARDYVVKTNLLRLPPAVERALREARELAGKREMEQALRVSEAGLRHAQSMAQLAHVVTGPNGSFESWSDSLPILIGVEPQQMPASTRAWLRLLHPEDRALFRGVSIEAARRRARMEVEYRLRRPDAAWIHIRQVIEPIEESAGAAGGIRWFNTLQDISAQKLAETALRASEERYRAAFEQTAVGIVHTSLDGEIVIVNPKFCEMSGYTRAEAIQLGIRQLAHPDDIEANLQGRSRLLSGTGIPYERDVRLVRKDRSSLWVSITTSLVRDSDAKPLHFISVLTDISERKRAEQEVERFRKAMDMSLDSIYITDPQRMTFVYVNDSACRRLGYPREKLLRMAPQDVLSATPEKLRREYDEVIATGERGMRSEHRFVTSDGSEGWTELQRRALHVAGERLIVTIGRDITNRKRAEEALRRFRFSVDNSGDMIIIIDRATMRHVDVNETTCRLLGYTREELLDIGPAETLPVAKEALERSYDELIANPAAEQRMRSYYRCKDGSQLPFESTRRALQLDDRWIIVAISRDIRQTIAAEQALRDSAALKGAILASSLDALVAIDHEGTIIEFNAAAEQIFGLAREQALGKRIDETVIPPRYRDAHRRGLARYLATGEASVLGRRVEITALRADGTEFPIELAIAPIKSGARPCFTAFVRDITARKEAEARITRLNRVHAVLSGINAAIVRINDRRALFEEACRICIEHGKFRMAWVGLVDHDEGLVKPIATAGDVGNFFETAPMAILENEPGGHGLAGRAVRGKVPVISQDVHSDPQRLMKSELAERGINSVAIIPLIVSDEAIGVIALYASEVGMFDDEEMRLLVELAGDISFALEHIEKTEQLSYLALHDPLTGLANRALLAERLAQSIREAGQNGTKFAIACFDLERLTTINESLGRQAGDALIRQVAVKFAHAAGAANVARVSGGELIVILPQVKGRSEAGRSAGKLARACFAVPFVVEGQELTVAAKAGLALFPNDGANAETLIGNAEAALRKAKDTGERQTFYSPDLTERTAATLTLENKLRRALEKDEFVLYYQPKLATDSRRIVGMEALIRWKSPELGLVPPAQFIPLMEQTGMILDVGTWALRRASLDHRTWAEQGLNPPRVAVNVSAIQLRQRDFVEAVQRAIAEGIAPTCIDLEITESLVMEDIEANIAKLKQVRSLGLQVAVDDFGTGYSSLSYLAKLPVQTLKIDRSFIIAMVDDPNTLTLVHTVISLAHSLSLKVVAEGVDAEEQAKLLRLLRCDEMQGYLFSKPVPREDIQNLLKKSAQGGA